MSNSIIAQGVRGYGFMSLRTLVGTPKIIKNFRDVSTETSCRQVGALRVCVRRLWGPNRLLSLRTLVESYEWLATRLLATEHEEAETRADQSMKNVWGKLIGC